MLPFDKWVTVRASMGTVLADKRVFFTGSTGTSLIMTDLDGNVLDTVNDPGGGAENIPTLPYAFRWNTSMYGRYLLRDVATGKIYYATNVGVFPITIAADGLTFEVGNKLFGYASDLPAGVVTWGSGGGITTIPNVYDGNFRARYATQLGASEQEGVVYSEAGAGTAIDFYDGFAVETGLDYVNQASERGHYGVSGTYGWEIFNWGLFDGISASATNLQIRVEPYSASGDNALAGGTIYNFPTNVCSFGLLSGRLDSSEGWSWLLLTYGANRDSPFLSYQTLSSDGQFETGVAIQGTLPQTQASFLPGLTSVRRNMQYIVGFGTMAIYDIPAGPSGPGFDVKVREIDTSYSGPRTIFDGEGNPASVTRGEATSIIVLDNPPASVYQDGQLSFEHDGTRYILRDLVRNGEYEDLWDATFRRVRI